MENKNLLLILVVVIAVVAVAAVVVVNGNSGVDIGGLKFNIPEKFVENTQRSINTTNTTVSGVTVNKTVKQFDNGNESIIIFVFETESSDVAKQKHNEDVKPQGETKTINGKEGTYMKDSMDVGFSYCDNNYIVTIRSTNDTLLESVVP